MVIWMIWFIAAVAVIAAKYYTVVTLTQLRLKLTARETRLAVVKAEGKQIKSSLEVSRRGLAVTRRRAADTAELIEKLKVELKELEDLEQKEMQVAKDLIDMLKDKKDE